MDSAKRGSRWACGKSGWLLQQETGNAAVTSTEFVGFLYCSYYYMYNENKIELEGILYNSCTN